MFGLGVLGEKLFLDKCGIDKSIDWVLQKPDIVLAIIRIQMSSALEMFT